MEEELCTERWKKSEHHAVVFNCTRFLLDGTSESSLRPLSLSNLDTSTSLGKKIAELFKRKGDFQFMFLIEFS